MDTRFVNFRPEWKTRHEAINSWEAFDLKGTEVYGTLEADGWMLDAFRYKSGWALYLKRETRE